MTPATLARAQTVPGNDVAGIDAQLEQVQQKIEQLREAQDEAVERYNRLEDELAQISARAEEAARLRDISAREAARWRNAFEERARLAYKRGGTTEQTVEMLINAESPARATAAMRVLNQIAVQDAEAAKRANEEALRQSDLEEEEREAFAAKARVAAEVEDEVRKVEGSIAAEQQFRASLDKTKQEALARIEEEQRRASESARAKIASTTGQSIPELNIGSGALKVFVSTALAQLGKPYVYGAAGPNSFDCSGLIMYSLNAAGVRGIPHRADLQYFLSSNHPSRGQLQPGDLVFFSSGGTPNGISHNGIYIGNGMMVHAPHTGDVVRIASVDRNWTNLLATRLAL